MHSAAGEATDLLLRRLALAGTSICESTAMMPMLSCRRPSRDAFEQSD